MRVVVTGGAGFLGSHLCEALLDRGDRVVCVDDLSSGTKANLQDLVGHPHFEFHLADVAGGMEVGGRIDVVVHLASPASPPDYLRRPLDALAAGSRGTEAALALAEQNGARMVLASTSEVYGEPHVHPQPETYWGHVNPVGVRSVYDEAKRFAEALTMAHHRALGTGVGIVRIFNTYGPRMRPDDGRVVSNFVLAALAGRPLHLYGDGTQTRSFCYVDDLVRGLVCMVDSSETGPINLGNPAELTVAELASAVVRLAGSSSGVETRPLPQDDPTRRKPDIRLAGSLLGWFPTIGPEEGLGRTIDWFRARI